MTSASAALQRAIYDKLTSAPAFSELSGIYDRVPKGAAFPFIAIGAGAVRDWSAKSFTGAEHRLAVDIWSEAPNLAEPKALMGEVHDALHEADLSLDGHQLVNLRFDFAEILQERDPELTHVVMRFRAVTRAVSV